MLASEIYAKVVNLKSGHLFQVKPKNGYRLVNASVHWEDDDFYILTNSRELDGTDSPVKHGFKYAWRITKEEVKQKENISYIEDVALALKTKPSKGSSSSSMSASLKTVQVGDVFTSQDTFNVLKTAVDLNKPALLVGETGVGKTALLRELAKEQKKELVRVSVNGTTGVEEILGKWLAEKGTTKWQDGVLVKAMKEGSWIVFDEINAALPEILFTLHSLLDDDQHIFLPEKDNEKIKPHKDFRFFSTMNPTEEYAGTKDLNKALASRFSAIINVEPLGDIDEHRILTEIYEIDNDTAFKLVSMGQELRKAKRDDRIYYFCSTRDLIQAGLLIKNGLNAGLAIKVAVVNKMSIPEQSEVKSHIQSSLSIESPGMSFQEMTQMAQKLESENKELKNKVQVAEQSEKKLKETLDPLIKQLQASSKK